MNCGYGVKNGSILVIMKLNAYLVYPKLNSLRFINTDELCDLKPFALWTDFKTNLSYHYSSSYIIIKILYNYILYIIIVYNHTFFIYIFMYIKILIHPSKYFVHIYICFLFNLHTVKA